MGDLTKNISYKELRPSGSPDTWKSDFALQDLMLKELTKNIQIVIDKTSCAPVSFSSGVRSASDYDRLVKLGYNPSPTSDHFCGNVVSIDPIKLPDKYKKFGEHYMFAVGAADTVPNKKIEDVFKAAVKMNQDKITNFGQIILERDPVKKTEWIHFGNNPALFFSTAVCSLINRPQYLTTIDGGKTYQAFV